MNVHTTEKIPAFAILESIYGELRELLTEKIDFWIAGGALSASPFLLWTLVSILYWTGVIVVVP